MATGTLEEVRPGLRGVPGRPMLARACPPSSLAAILRCLLNTCPSHAQSWWRPPPVDTGPSFPPGPAFIRLMLFLSPLAKSRAAAIDFGAQGLLDAPGSPRVVPLPHRKTRQGQDVLRDGFCQTLGFCGALWTIGGSQHHRPPTTRTIGLDTFSACNPVLRRAAGGRRQGAPQPQSRPRRPQPRCTDSIPLMLAAKGPSRAPPGQALLLPSRGGNQHLRAEPALMCTCW